MYHDEKLRLIVAVVEYDDWREGVIFTTDMDSPAADFVPTAYSIVEDMCVDAGTIPRRFPTEHFLART